MEELRLVRRGTPATVDDELDPVVRGIRRGLPQGTEESWIELGHTRNRVVEDRRAVRDGTAGLAKRTMVLERCSLRRTSMGGAALGDAVEGEDPGHWWPKAAAIAPRTTSRTATRILRIRRGAVGTRSL